MNKNMQCGSEVVGALWVTEISSPFLHWREIIKELGYKDTGLNLIADVSFIYFALVPKIWYNINLSFFLIIYFLISTT